MRRPSGFAYGKAGLPPSIARSACSHLATARGDGASLLRHDSALRLTVAPQERPPARELAEAEPPWASPLRGHALRARSASLRLSHAARAPTWLAPRGNAPRSLRTHAFAGRASLLRHDSAHPGPRPCGVMRSAHGGPPLRLTHAVRAPTRLAPRGDGASLLRPHL